MMKRISAFLCAFALLAACLAGAAAENKSDGTFPSRYDMQEDGIVTPVKLLDLRDAGRGGNVHPFGDGKNV